MEKQPNLVHDYFGVTACTGGQGLGLAELPTDPRQEDGSDVDGDATSLLRSGLSG